MSHLHIVRISADSLVWAGLLFERRVLTRDLRSLVNLLLGTKRVFAEFSANPARKTTVLRLAGSLA